MGRGKGSARVQHQNQISKLCDAKKAARNVRLTMTQPDQSATVKSKTLLLVSDLALGEPSPVVQSLAYLFSSINKTNTCNKNQE